MIEKIEDQKTETPRAHNIIEDPHEELSEEELGNLKRDNFDDLSNRKTAPAVETKEISKERQAEFAKNLQKPEFLGKIWDDRIEPNYDTISPYKLELMGLTPRQAELTVARLIDMGVLELSPERKHGLLTQDRPNNNSIVEKGHSTVYKIKDQYVGKKWAQLYGPPPEKASPVQEVKPEAVKEKPKSFFQKLKGLFSRKQTAQPEVAPETPTVMPIDEEPITAEVEPSEIEKGRDVPTAELPVMDAAQVVAAAQEEASVSERSLDDDVHVEAAIEFYDEFDKLLAHIRENRINNPDAVYVLLREELSEPKIQDMISRMNPKALDTILFNTLKSRDRNISESVRGGIALYLNKIRDYPIKADSTKKFVKYSRTKSQKVA